MELIKLVLPDEEQIEFQIALVDEPAIESDWQVFSKGFQFKEVDKSKKILMGYFMIADMKIPRFDQQRGAYEVIFPRESIDAIVRNFSKNGLNQNMNEDHRTGELSEGVYVLNHWQLDSEMEIKAPKGFKTEADGSWFGIVKCDNDEIYQRALRGEINGFSIENRFIEEAFRKVNIDAFLKQLQEEINTINK